MERIFECYIKRLSPQKKRELMEKLIPRMIHGVKSEDMLAMLCQALPQIMKAMDAQDPEKRKQAITQVVRALTESNGSTNVAEIMRLVVPEILEGCFSAASPEERGKMLSVCHTTLKEMEARFPSRSEEQEAVAAGSRQRR